MLFRFFRFLASLLPERKRPVAALSEDWDELDVGYDDDLTSDDLERLQTNETGEAVGITAVIDQEEVKQSQGKLPARVETETLLENYKNILWAAKCTSFVLVERVKIPRRSPNIFYGTAFFVSDRLLVTAGHGITDSHCAIIDIRITPPGLERVRPLQVAQHKVFTISCTLVGTIGKRAGQVSGEIALLEADSSFTAPAFLPLFSFPLPAKAMVAIIGYPGEIKYEWIRAHDALRIPEHGKAEAEQLFSTGSLTVSWGTIEEGGSTITYHMSTCPGMSGACILYEEFVVGVRST